jgi:hypothetical protein
MTKSKLADDLEKLNNALLLTKKYEDYKDLQTQLDKISALSEHDSHKHQYEYLLYEAQARLHYLQFNHSEASKFLDEAERLRGGEYPDSIVLKQLIYSRVAANDRLQQHNDHIKRLNDEKSRAESFLALAILVLFFLAIGFFSNNSKVSKQSKIIDTCVSDISSLNSAITDANSTLDSISSSASSASGSEYDEQASTLDQISNDASDAKKDPPSTDCAQISDESSSSSD